MGKSALHLAKELFEREKCDRCGAAFDPTVKRELSAILDFDFGRFSNRNGEQKTLLFCNECAQRLQDSIMNKE